MYLIYDTETTGLTQSFDQITEFAAVVLDDTFKIKDKISIDIRLTRDSIPALEALQVVHRLPSHNIGLSEPEALTQIHRWLSSCPWNGGYNTLRFDDEVLRFSFYRHGLPPYAHQAYPQHKRFDLLPMVACFYLIHPHEITWPHTETGRVSLKLESLNHMNGWIMGDAHEALFDVEVTASLLAHLRSVDVDLFEYLLLYFDRQIDQKRSFDYLITQQSLSWGYLIDPRFGSERQFVQACEYLGPHPNYANQSLWRSFEQPERILKKKWGEPPFLLSTKIERYLHTSVTPPPSTVAVPFSTIERPEHPFHPEADLYTHTGWRHHSIHTRRSSALHQWRYEGLSDPGLEDYCLYLKTGEGSVPYDHLQRQRRHLKMIDERALAQASPAIQRLYDDVRERIQL